MIDGEQDFATFETQANGGDDEGTAPAAEAAAEADGVTEAAEVADEAVEAAEAEAAAPVKAKPTAQERIDEITRARREAERQADYWKGVAEGRIAPEKANGHAPASDEPKAPDPLDFDYGETDPLYLKALVAHEVQQGIKSGLDKAKESMAKESHIQAQERVWEAKKDAARSKFDDFDAVTQTHDPETGAARWLCSQEMAIAIRTSDVGGELAYHLASNPEEARRISALDPISQIRALGRLEASLDAPVSAPPANKQTNAPKPAEGQARGSGGQFAPNAATTDFSQFEAMANRKT